MSNPINLDQSYSSTLSNALQQVFLATELGGNANLTCGNREVRYFEK